MSDLTPGRGVNPQKGVSTRTRCTSTDISIERYNHHHGDVTLHETSRTQNFESTEPNSTIRKPTDSSGHVLSGTTAIAAMVEKPKNAPSKRTMTDRNDDDGGKSDVGIADREDAVQLAQKNRDNLEPSKADDGNVFGGNERQDDEFS